MKRITLIFVLLIIFSCSNNDDNNNSGSETNLELVTGINIRNSEYSTATQLGNPNVLVNSQFVAYPNPPNGILRILASENITDVWLIAANAKKTNQQTDFSSVLNSNLYPQSLIETNSQIDFTDLNTINLTLNLENLNSGYYRLFVKINGALYWDNIYILENNFDIQDLINYWN